MKRFEARVRSEALQQIRSNIDRHGHHLYIVAPHGPVPRWAYTIGLCDSVGCELVLAGAIAYSAADVGRIVNEVAMRLRTGFDRGRRETCVEGLGTFRLCDVDPSWGAHLLLGAVDFYDRKSIPALQIVPDESHWTMDVPELNKARSTSSDPVWQWLDGPWTFPVPPRSTATTNLAALRGARVTEAARWEDDQWELFAGAGPDLPKKDLRVVPLGTLLGIDASLAVVTELSLGQALWRDHGAGEWHEWQ